MSTCVLEAKLGEDDIKGLLQLFQPMLDDPLIQALIWSYYPDADIDKINETVSFILSLWCTDRDRLGGRSASFQFVDNVTPICQVRCATLLADFTAECFT